MDKVSFKMTQKMETSDMSIILIVVDFSDIIYNIYTSLTYLCVRISHISQFKIWNFFAKFLILLFFFSNFENRLFSYNISWLQLRLPLILSVSPLFLSHLDPLLFCLLEMNRLLRDNNQTKQDKIQDKTKPIISKLDKTSQPKKNNPRKGTRIRDPLFYIQKVPQKY